MAGGVGSQSVGAFESGISLKRSFKGRSFRRVLVPVPIGNTVQLRHVIRLSWNRLRSTQLDSLTGRPLSRDRLFSGANGVVAASSDANLIRVVRYRG